MGARLAPPAPARRSVAGLSRTSETHRPRHLTSPMELATGIEPVTSSLPRKRSTTELRERVPAATRGLPCPCQYPHGESNPGFRAENAAS